MVAKENKSNLLQITEAEYAKLKQLIEEIDETAAEACTSEGYSAKQLVGNLSAWIGLFFDWCLEASAGRSPRIPKAGYLWREQRRLDADIWFAQQSKAWGELVQELNEQHAKLVTYLKSRNNQELYGRPLSYEWSWTEGRLAEIAGADRFRAAYHILWKHLTEVKV